ncbi:MAG: hypothetical protein JWO56_15, partial [Acidobacteria bacterium]|nr:hypothetical protein [Acidobacteriota bacterium]
EQSRLKLQLTQEMVADLAGISRRHLANMEKGNNFSILVLIRVARVLGLTRIQLGELTFEGEADAADLAPLFDIATTVDRVRATLRNAKEELDACSEDLQRMVGGEPLPDQSAEEVGRFAAKARGSADAPHVTAAALGRLTLDDGVGAIRSPGTPRERLASKRGNTSRR